jgi:hypothetical protein
MNQHSGTTPNSDMDGGWKDVIEDFTEDCWTLTAQALKRMEVLSQLSQGCSLRN